MRTRLSSPWSALLLILGVLGALWPRTAITPLSSYDQRFYLGIADDLRTHRRFTDGFSYAGGGAGVLRPPGMRFVPLYPGFLALAASLDPQLRSGMACVERSLGRDPACPRAAPLARTAQFLMLAGFYWLLWASIRQATASVRAGWFGLATGLVAAPSLLLFVNTLMTETMSLLLSGTACALAASAAVGGARRSHLRWLAAGAALGLAALCRPAFLTLLWPALGLGSFVAARRRSGSLAAATAAFGAGTAMVVLPWVLRNLLVLHRAALTFGYASHTLIQRVAFDSMTRREYGLSFVCWLPGGPGLGRWIAGSGACDRFGWDEHPNSFYAIGTGPLLRQTLAASGGWANHMSYVVHHDLLAHPFKHLLVTLPLMVRGVCVDRAWGLLLAPVSAWSVLRAARRGDAGVLLLSLPAWFLLLVNALVAVNQPRYNFLLVLPFSLGAALLMQRLLPRDGKRRIAGN